MDQYEELVKRVIIALGNKELKEAFNTLYYYMEYDDMGELHKANDLFTTLVREAMLREPTLTVPIKNFIVGIYMNALDIPEDVAHTYVQKNIVNNTLH